jgi:hypothetical protein
VNETVFPADSGADKIGKLFEQILTRAGGSPGAVSKAIPREFLTVEGLPDWNVIPPEILGDIFQDMMNAEDRHDIGAHYTSERNILKLIHPLFLDGLREEFESIKKLSPSLREERLKKFHEKLAHLKFLDPACGCGNFLVVSYRELRLLELETIALLLRKEKVLDAHNAIKVNVNQFYGIEIEEFPAQIAQTAMRLIDRQMNTLVRERFGTCFTRVPLTAAAHIHNANALTTDWESVVPKEQLSYILGNPPFLGKKEQSFRQKRELVQIFDGLKRRNVLDYVACWYKKAAQYMKGTKIETAFVSTNSICQGEQVPVLWQELLNKHGVKINFAHQTFKWRNEARGNAAVHCVIIGFSQIERKEKKIFHYADGSAEPAGTKANKINAYLVDAATVFIESRRKPLCSAPEMHYGSMPIDGGYLILSEEEKKEFVRAEPITKSMIRPYYGGDEFIYRKKRYCIWLLGIAPEIIGKSKLIQDRIKKTQTYRKNSARAETRNLANTPGLFGEIRQPKGGYLLIPKICTDTRQYIPIGFMPQNNITNGSALLIPNAGLYEFGILSSNMHMAWTRRVGGRLGNALQYSASLAYNNFPWSAPAEKQREAVETAAQAILDTRSLFPGSTLAVLYHPSTMPPELARAHQALDKAADAAYGRSFADDGERVAYLFERYQQLSGQLFRDEQKRGKGRKV